MKCSVKKADCRQKKRGAEEGGAGGEGIKGEETPISVILGEKKKRTGDRREQLDGCNKRENGGLTKGT